MKGTLLLLLFLSVLSFSGFTERGSSGLLYAEVPEGPVSLSYSPYLEDEFSPWMHDLRRAESLFFGSLPLTYGIASLSFTLFANTDSQLTTQDYLNRLSAAALLSAAIAVTDYILGIIENESN